MILTTPFGKKEGCEAMTPKVTTAKGGSVGFSTIHSCRASLNSNSTKLKEGYK